MASQAIAELAEAASAGSQTYLSLHEVTKHFGPTIAVDHVDLEIPQASFVCFLGPSGCGKTTLLRLIAGLERLDEGVIRLSGSDLAGVPERLRNFGMVFQSYSLFPSLNVFENVAYGLRCRCWREGDIAARVKELLRLVGVEDQAEKYQHMLSGGQQQRVALARALAPHPHVLLLDEPLSALDAKVRRSLRQEIRKLQKELGITTVMVTHDQEEALTMADHVVVLDRGRIVQQGAPTQIYDEPQTPFVADFIGNMNFLPAQTIGPGHYRSLGRDIHVAARADHASDKSVLLAIRPEQIRVLRGQEAATGGATNIVQARVDWVEFLGGNCHLRLTPLEADDVSINAEVPTRDTRELKVAVGSPVAVMLPPDAFRVFPA